MSSKPFWFSMSCRRKATIVLRFNSFRVAAIALVVCGMVAE